MRFRYLAIGFVTILIFWSSVTPSTFSFPDQINSMLSTRSSVVDADLKLRSDISWQQIAGNSTFSPNSIFVDADGDGEDELITYEYYYNLSNNVQYHWTIWEYLEGSLIKKVESKWPSPQGATNQTLFFEVKDLDNDTQPEIIASGHWHPNTNINKAFLGVFHYDGTSLTLVDSKEWQEVTGKDTTFRVYNITDLDGDGNSEIIGRCDWTDDSDYSHVYTQIWEYTGSSLKQQALVKGIPRLLDVVGDSRLDLVVDSFSISGGKKQAILKIYYYNGSSLLPLSTKIWQEVTNRDTYAFADTISEDLDGDGNIEIITRGQWEDSNGKYHAQLSLWRVNRTENSLVHLSNTSWQIVSGYDTDLPDVYAHDIDGDSSKEVITANSYSYNSDSKKFQWVIWELVNNSLIKKAESNWPDPNSPKYQELSLKFADLDKNSQVEIIAFGHVFPAAGDVSKALLAIFHYDGNAINLVSGDQWQEGTGDYSTFIVSQIIELDTDGNLEIVGDCYWNDSSGNYHHSTQIWEYSDSITREATVEGSPSTATNLIGSTRAELLIDGFIISEGKKEAILRIYNYSNNILSTITSQSWQMISGNDATSFVKIIEDFNKDGFIEFLSTGSWVDNDSAYHAQLRLWELNLPFDTTPVSQTTGMPGNNSISSQTTGTTEPGGDGQGFSFGGLAIIGIIGGLIGLGVIFSIRNISKRRERSRDEWF